MQIDQARVPKQSGRSEVTPFLECDARLIKRFPEKAPREALVWAIPRYLVRGTTGLVVLKRRAKSAVCDAFDLDFPGWIGEAGDG